MPQTNLFSAISYLTAGPLIFLLHTHLIWQTGFFDYDSAHNWQIIQEISQGNYQHLFQHASPSFFLFYAAFTPVSKDFHFYILLNCLFNVLGILLTVKFIERQFSLSILNTFLLILFAGLSGYLTANSRYFTIEAPSLFFFALLLPLYYQRFTEQSRKAFYRVIALVAFGLTINYKFLLLFPVALLLELLHPDKVINSRRIIYSILILLLPFLVYGLVAFLVGLPFYRFPAAYANLFYNFKVPTPGSRLGFFNFDVFYYGRYFLRFESPLLLVGLVLFPLLFRRQIFEIKQNKEINIYRYLFLLIYLYLAGMHVLQKAPRGLFLVYTLLYTITLISCAQTVRSRKLTFSILVLSFIYQSFVLQREFYAYAHTNYPQVVAYLQNRKITKIATTVGLGITPYAQTANLEITPVFDETQLNSLKVKGYRYVLLDDYYLAANIRKFKNLEVTPPLASWPEPSLISPFLYLDQCEFTGFSYQQALQSQQQVAQDSIQLRLLRIP
ncbi:hypothetical protein AHMF7605_12595 [Adhaeribacter arboris]|uniref:Glycosyltransferase RgtA/B/C/D-like domain-containing protein n=1 Tax=Adhaeribacter arboris TaxID=2072846 RepID=A0A2T2YFQ5_9BACT|nr:hypothetical protein [Adhaeribacter arboris]PSR54298.1 hypothetical protein AHMF7605_12595 [Adhaeribacter arboris]